MKRTMRKKNNEGAAVLIVMCILCVFMALSLSMIFISFQVLSNAQQSTTKEQAKISAVTFNKILKNQITDEAGTTGYVKGDAPKNIREYLYNQIDTDVWPYYDAGVTGHEKDDAMRDVEISGISEDKAKNFGTVKVKIYWQQQEEDSDMKNPILVTVVTDTFRKQSYSVKTKYVLANSADKTTWHWTVTWEDTN